ncbi:MAG: TraR/DksA C4-type zinc finger protein [Rhodospirillales bacterium]|nr:TraR/DksA C4-type zinc finger protein [Acetobacter sp.]
MPKSKPSAKQKPAAEAAPEEAAPASKPSAAAGKGNGHSAAPAASDQDLTASVSSYFLRSQKNEDEADAKLSPFLRKQKKRLLALRDAMLDSMNGMAQDNLRARAEGNEASAFGMHQADAGSDAYDRDFALNLLSQEQDALYEIDEAIKRIELGTYGTCEMSGKPINHERLEAIPFTRFTVECQSQIERQNKAKRVRQSVTSLFGLTDDEKEEGDEEEFTPDNKE